MKATLALLLAGVVSGTSCSIDQSPLVSFVYKNSHHLVEDPSRSPDAYTRDISSGFCKFLSKEAICCSRKFTNDVVDKYQNDRWIGRTSNSIISAKYKDMKRLYQERIKELIKTDRLRSLAIDIAQETVDDVTHGYFHLSQYIDNCYDKIVQLYAIVNCEVGCDADVERFVSNDVPDYIIDDADSITPTTQRVNQQAQVFHPVLRIDKETFEALFGACMVVRENLKSASAYFATARSKFMQAFEVAIFEAELQENGSVSASKGLELTFDADFDATEFKELFNIFDSNARAANALHTIFLKYDMFSAQLIGSGMGTSNLLTAKFMPFRSPLAQKSSDNEYSLPNNRFKSITNNEVNTGFKEMKKKERMKNNKKYSNKHISYQGVITGPIVQSDTKTSTSSTILPSDPISEVASNVDALDTSKAKDKSSTSSIVSAVPSKLANFFESAKILTHKIASFMSTESGIEDTTTSANTENDVKKNSEKAILSKQSPTTSFIHSQSGTKLKKGKSKDRQSSKDGHSSFLQVDSTLEEQTESQEEVEEEEHDEGSDKTHEDEEYRSGDSLKSPGLPLDGVDINNLNTGGYKIEKKTSAGVSASHSKNPNDDDDEPKVTKSENGVTTQTNSDGSKAIRTIHPDGSTTTRFYDAKGELIQTEVQTPADGSVTLLIPNEDGKKITKKRNDDGSWDVVVDDEHFSNVSDLDTFLPSKTGIPAPIPFHVPSEGDDDDSNASKTLSKMSPSSASQMMGTEETTSVDKAKNTKTQKKTSKSGVVTWSETRDAAGVLVLSTATEVDKYGNYVSVTRKGDPKSDLVTRVVIQAKDGSKITIMELGDDKKITITVKTVGSDDFPIVITDKKGNVLDSSTQNILLKTLGLPSEYRHYINLYFNKKEQKGSGNIIGTNSNPKAPSESFANSLSYNRRIEGTEATSMQSLDRDASPDLFTPSHAAVFAFIKHEDLNPAFKAGDFIEWGTVNVAEAIARAQGEINSEQSDESRLTKWSKWYRFFGLIFVIAGAVCIFIDSVPYIASGISMAIGFALLSISFYIYRMNVTGFAFAGLAVVSFIAFFVLHQKETSTKKTDGLEVDMEDDEDEALITGRSAHSDSLKSSGAHGSEVQQLNAVAGNP